MSHIIELPEPIYSELLEAANATGVTPADWIAARLPARKTQSGKAGSKSSSKRDIAEANARLWRHAIELDHATGIDNDAIDSDLAREYANHAGLGSTNPPTR